MRRTSQIATILAAALAMSACTSAVDDVSDSPSVNATEQEDPTESPEPIETTPALPADAGFTPASDSSQSSGFDEAAGGDLLMNDVRMPSDSRVVITIEGTTVPEWRAEYPENPTTQGKGDTVELMSPAVFALTLRSFGYPENDVVFGDIGEDIFVDPPFEGTTAVFIGRPSPQDYRVTIDANTIIIEFLTD